MHWLRLRWPLVAEPRIGGYDQTVALREHAQKNEVTKVRETGFGPRYEVEGELTAPDGRRPRVCTVWQMDDDETAPRLITAYPLERDE